jgi:hypothetical protein
VVQGKLGTGPVIGTIPSTWLKFAYPHQSRVGHLSREYPVVVLCGCGEWLVTDRRARYHRACMPQYERGAMTRACMVGGCPRPAVKGRSRCKGHGPASQRGPNEYGYSWQRLREQAKQVLPMVCAIGHHPLLSFEQAHLDHIIPRSMGGRDVIENVQWSCPKHNISKGGANRARYKNRGGSKSPT